MAQIRFRLGPHVLAFDPDEPMTMLDAVAMRVVSRDLGIDAADLAAKAMTDLTTAGETAIATAYLCAVRRDRELRWREFLASIPVDVRPELVEDEPGAGTPERAAPDPAAQGGGVAASLTGRPQDPPGAESPS